MSSTRGDAVEDTDVLEVFRRGNDEEFLKQLARKSSLESYSGDEEELLLAKGVSLLRTKQYAASRREFSEGQFDSRKEEAKIYEECAVTCWLASSLEAAMELSNEGKLQEALQAYEQMPLESPLRGAEAVMYQKYNNEACCLFKLEKYEEALALLTGSDMKRTLEKSEKSSLIENEFNVGMIYKKLQQFERSIASFDKCLEVVNSMSSVKWLSQLQFERIDAMLALNKWSEALEEVNILLSDQKSSSNESDVTLIILKAVASIYLGHIDDALTAVVPFSEKSLSSPLASDISQVKIYCYEKKGFFYFQNQDFLKAAEAYNSALKVISEFNNSASLYSTSLSQSHVSVLYNLAMTYMQLNKPDTAEQKFTYVIQLLSSSNSSGASISSSLSMNSDAVENYLFQAYRSLGHILMRRANLLPMEEEGLDKDNDSVSSNDDHNLTKWETYALAVEAYAKASAIRCKDIDILYTLGVAQVKAGLLNEARESFAKILSNEPEHEDCSKAMSLITSYLAAQENEKRKKEEEEREKEREQEAEKKRLEEAAKTPVKSTPPMNSSPPKTTYQSAAFRKFNSPQTTTHKTTGQKMYSNVKESTVNAKSSKEPSPAPVVQETPKQDGVFYPYEQLKSPGPYPPGVDATSDREMFLSDEEFLKVLKVSKDEFSKFPGWKKISKKKAAGLF